MGNEIHREVIRPLNWSPADLSSLSGKVAIVTGANTLENLGGNAAHTLALKGAKVYIGARTLDKAKAGITEILSKSPSIPAANLQPFVADVGNYQQVKAAAEQFLQREERLDILVNNAGMIVPGLDLDQYGVNTIMAANHLGPFLLTKLLLPLLEKTAKADPKSDVRIVNVASSANFLVPPTASFTSLAAWNDPFGGDEDPAQSYKRYGFSKAANIAYSRELQRRLDESGTRILVTSLHPGMVATPGAGRLLGTDTEDFQTSATPYDGALTIIWCAAHPEVKEREAEFKGQFIFPFGGVKEAIPLAESAEEAKALWRVSEEILERVFKA